MALTYSTVCPNCGVALAVMPVGVDTAPWVCAGCAHGFWPSELSDEARQAWRPLYRDHGFGDVAVRVAAARGDEQAAALMRGTPLVADMLPLLASPVLRRLAALLQGRTGPLAVETLATVQAVLAGRGV